MLSFVTFAARPLLGELVPIGRAATLTASQYVANNALHNLRDYGARGDGFTNDTAAILAAAKGAAKSLHRVVLVPPGRYLMDGGALMLGNDGVTDYTGVTFVGYGQDVSTFVRSAAGILFDVWVDRNKFLGVDIDDNGAAGFAGEAIKISASGRRFTFDGGAIRNSLTRCIYFSADRGTYARVQSSQFWRYTPGGDYSDPVNNPGGATETVRPPCACIYIGDDTNNPMYRKFVACDTAPYHDLLDDGGQLTQIIGCSSHNHIMRPNVKKTMMTSTRLAPHGQYTIIDGIEHSFSGNTFGNVVRVLNSVNNLSMVGNMYSGDATFPSGIDDQSAPGTNTIVGGATRSAFAGAYLRNAGELRTTLAINPGTLAAGARAKFAGLSMPGAVVGMKIRASSDVIGGVLWWAEVTSLSTVTVYAMNMDPSAGATPGLCNVTLVGAL